MTIGEVAERAGLAVSAIRFYKDKGLVTAERTTSGHRQFLGNSTSEVARER